MSGTDELLDNAERDLAKYEKERHVDRQLAALNLIRAGKNIKKAHGDDLTPAQVARREGLKERWVELFEQNTSQNRNT